MNVGNLIENFAIWKFSRISKSSDQLARAQEHDWVASLCKVMPFRWACHRRHLQGREARERLELAVYSGSWQALEKSPCKGDSPPLISCRGWYIEDGHTKRLQRHKVNPVTAGLPFVLGVWSQSCSQGLWRGSLFMALVWMNSFNSSLRLENLYHQRLLGLTPVF